MEKGSSGVSLKWKEGRRKLEPEKKETTYGIDGLTPSWEPRRRPSYRENRPPYGIGQIQALWLSQFS